MTPDIATAPILCSLCDELVQPGEGHPTFFRCCQVCVEREHGRLRAAWATARPYDTQHEPGRPSHHGPGDIRVLNRASPEGRVELERRAAHTTRQHEREGLGVDAALAGMLIGGGR